MALKLAPNLHLMPLPNQRNGNAMKPKNSPHEDNHHNDHHTTPLLRSVSVGVKKKSRSVPDGKWNKPRCSKGLWAWCPNLQTSSLKIIPNNHARVRRGQHYLGQNQCHARFADHGKCQLQDQVFKKTRPDIASICLNSNVLLFSRPKPVEKPLNRGFWLAFSTVPQLHRDQNFGLEMDSLKVEVGLRSMFP